MKVKTHGIAVGIFFLLLVVGIHGNAIAQDLYVFSGAGLRQPVDRLVKNFQQRTSHHIFVDYAGSGQHTVKIHMASKCDVFIPGSLFYIEKLQVEGKIKSFRPVACHTPVIGVNAGQAKRITCFEDLAAPGIRLAMGDPKAMALGRTAVSICEKSGLKEAIEKNVTVYGATVKQLALYVSQGVVDAAIIGRADAVQNAGKITMVPIPRAWFEPEVIAAAVLQSTSVPEVAREFCDYLGSNSGVRVFQEYGFLPIEE